jgi:hypothetical protein
MSHIVFFSYANKDLNPLLVNFFADLCGEISEYTEYTPEDPQIGFRDKLNLPMGENWRNNIVHALQTSDVMLCVTSTKYLNSEFCAREFYFFDQRRRQDLKTDQQAPPVILPLIWNPTDRPLPKDMEEVQQVPKEVSEEYRKRGLREILLIDGPESKLYKTCVNSFAKAIYAASESHGKKVKPLKNVPDFENIPNTFSGGRWQDDVVVNGEFVKGPEVANFVFAAPSKNELDDPEGRYGADGSQWRPFFPREMDTVLQHATDAVKKQFKFREIPVDDKLEAELRRAKTRGNLSIVIGEPAALDREKFKGARSIEDLWWEGCAVFATFHEHERIAKLEEQEAAFRRAFPVLSQAPPSTRVGRPRNPAELQAALDAALFEMRKVLIQPAIDSKGKTDSPPPGISGSRAARS